MRLDSVQLALASELTDLVDNISITIGTQKNMFHTTLAHVAKISCEDTLYVVLEFSCLRNTCALFEFTH